MLLDVLEGLRRDENHKIRSSYAYAHALAIVIAIGYFYLGKSFTS